MRDGISLYRIGDRIRTRNRNGRNDPSGSQVPPCSQRRAISHPDDWKWHSRVSRHSGSLALKPPLSCPPIPNKSNPPNPTLRHPPTCSDVQCSPAGNARNAKCKKPPTDLSIRRGSLAFGGNWEAKASLRFTPPLPPPPSLQRVSWRMPSALRSIARRAQHLPRHRP